MTSKAVRQATVPVRLRSAGAPVAMSLIVAAALAGVALALGRLVLGMAFVMAAGLVRFESKS